MPIEAIISLLAAFVPVVLWTIDRRSRSAAAIADSRPAKTAGHRISTLSQVEIRPQSAATDSELTLERVPKYGVVKGYLPHWHRGPGDYEAGKDFLWLEYEVALARPHRVNIQVEGPTRETSIEWNEAKMTLLDAVLAIQVEISRPASRGGWSIERGRRATKRNARQDKCTTVFEVGMDSVAASATPEEGAFKRIQALHEAVGSLLDGAMRGST